MTNLKILFKYNFIQLLGTLQGKRQRKRTSVAISLLALGVVLILGLYTLQAYSMFVGLGAMGLEKVCLFHACITTVSVLLILGIMRVTGNPKFSDTDLLLSLPLRRSEIIISKTINRYLFDFCFVFLLFLPYVILYQIFTQFSVLTTILGLVAVLVLPLFSVGLSYIVDFVITRLFNKFKSASILKSIFTTIIYVTIIVLMLIKTMSYGTLTGSLDAYFADRPVSNLIMTFVLRGGFLPIASMLAFTILPFLLGVILFSFSFGKHIMQYSAKDQALKFSASASSFGSIIKKEFKTYFSIPSYLINTIIGPIMILGFGVVVSIMGENAVSELFGMGGALPWDVISGMIGLVFCFSASLTLISCSSLSLEGKNLWILTSTPVNERALFMAKVLPNIIMVSPVILVSSLILTLTFSLSILQFCFICLVPILLNFALSFLGLIINIWLPKFDWVDEIQVVKQSMATLLCMVLGLVMTLIPVGLLLIFDLAITWIAIISAVVYALVLIFSIIFLFSKGVKMFRKLN